MKSKHLFIRRALAASSVAAVVISATAAAQTPVPVALVPNGITVLANGIAFTVKPGDSPTFSAVSTTDGTPIAVSKTIRFIDKHGRDVDPRSITLRSRFQAIYDTTSSGSVIQQVMVDRD